MALAGTALLVAPAGAAAQGRIEEIRSLEAYGARYALNKRVGTSTDNLDGFGLRLLYERRNPDRVATNFLSRTRSGIFATYTARQGSPSLSTLHAGLETDLSIFPQPLASVLDPLISVGLGVFRTSRENVITTNRQGKRIIETAFALTPGVGTRIGLIDRVGARVDVRVPLLVGTATTANLVGEGGIYFSF